MKNWFIGQQIVCIDVFTRELKRLEQQYGDTYKGIIVPQLNGIYTIREIIKYPNDEELGFLLQEIKNKKYDYKISGLSEPTFNETAFRPFVEKKTDISIFTEILNKANKQKFLDLIDSH
jgi:hypothetical protein